MAYALSAAAPHTALPAGVGHATTTRLVSARRPRPGRSAEYTWTATDEDGDEAALSFSATVVEPPAVTLALSAATIDEHDGTDPGSATVTATLDKASSAGTTVTVTATAGTNAAAGDFALSADATLTIAAGETTSTGTVTVTAVNNAKDEDDKSVTVSGSAANDVLVTDPADLTLTIADDDAAPALSIDAPSVTEGAAGATATLDWTVTLSAESGKEVTVAWAEGTGGTATAGTDYTALAGGTLTIAAGRDERDGLGDGDGRRRGRAGRDGDRDAERPVERDARGRGGERDGHDRGRRRRADGDAGAFGFVDFGERRDDDGVGDAVASVERGRRR